MSKSFFKNSFNAEIDPFWLTLQTAVSGRRLQNVYSVTFVLPSLQKSLENREAQKENCQIPKCKREKKFMKILQ